VDKKKVVLEMFWNEVGRNFFYEINLRKKFCGKNKIALQNFFFEKPKFKEKSRELRVFPFIFPNFPKKIST